MWVDRRPILWLIIAGAIVHGCVLIAVHVRTGRIDGYAFASRDSGEYYQIARNLIEHRSFSQSEKAPLRPDTWRTPGYPLFLAGMMVVVGKSPVGFIVVQQLLSVLNVFLLFRIVLCHMTARRALLVAALFLFEPYHLYYSTWLMSATLFITVLLLVWIAWQRAGESRSWMSFALLGALSGMSVLVRPVGILIPFVVFCGILLSTRTSRTTEPPTKSVRAPWTRPTVFAATVLVVCGVWMLRNKAVAGHFALSDQGGVVLAYFKATEVALWRESRTADRYIETSLDPAQADAPHTLWDEIDKRLQGELSHLAEARRAELRWPNLAQGNKTSVDSFAISAALTRIGRSMLAESPIATAACYLTRCGAILTFPLNLVLTRPQGVEMKPVRIVLALPYLLLCIAVVVRLIRGGLAHSGVFFPLACTIALLLATTPQIDPRFRVPMIPLLLFIALASKKQAPE
ncbi:MAG: glycosyltransferase family 39 protein [Phycisphaerales bacterium]|nr:MAG: glycosyltransferase family 39 protein [Phycisphaerales bacterium]